MALPRSTTLGLVFFASGFAGLIYESIWTHYLKLFLGHAAHAQTLVLAIFMGGMAIGAALAARRSAGIRHPLRAYAAIEAAIGMLAWAFHAVYTSSTEGFYAVAQAQQLQGGTFTALKWLLATLLILPQSVLLGATFPLFAAAATRADEAATGRSLATLYFANSLGGALGVLASGFVLVPHLGLPATMAVAGTLNLAIAAVVWRGAGAVAATQGGAMPRARAPLGRLELLLLLVSALTGASSFVYEVAWIRMLSLVLGSATHSFELMLSSFILGLALGGAWIRKRIDGAAHPGRMLGHIQIVMGCAALATVPLHSASFDLVAWAVQAAPKTDTGYALFNGLRYGIASLIMFPAAFCAGMTLPLVTRILFDRPGQGERAIGLVYGANTLGAICGLAFAVHIGMPVFGLEYLVASGAMVDVALGVLLLVVYGGRARFQLAGAALLGSAAATVAVASTFNPQKLASGVFRSGEARIAGQVLALAHGKTATVSVELNGATMVLRTNGKPDASAMVGGMSATGGHSLDEVTMALIGTLPLMLHDSPRRVANIGFGAGITGDLILGDPRVERMDTVEIEPVMVEMARHFGALNRRNYDDPRSVVHIDDAKSFFASHGKTYDLIVSEPSNPWVSGVAGLFSVEFYRHVSRYLAEGGLFAQWLQVYETHPDRVVSVLKAVDQVFGDYLVVALDRSDILIVASPRGKVALQPDAFDRLSPAIRGQLRRIAVATPSDITYRVVGNRALLKPWLDAQPVPANSDFAPYLDSHADHDRFVGAQWHELPGLATSAYPLVEVLGARPPLATPSGLSINQHLGHEPPALAARQVADALLGPAPLAQVLPVPAGLPPDLAAQGRQVLAACADPPLGDRGFAAAGLALKVLPYLSVSEGGRVLDALAGAACLQPPAGAAAAWPQLLRQVAARDAAGFGATAEGLLAAGQGGTETRSRYLLGMAMLGHLGSGHAERARAVWDRFSGPLLGGKPPSLALDVLRARAGGVAMPTVPAPR
ncbi:spermidine synthase [Ideonella sp. A 288]|uniref:spermine/spermidine synthase domain-containing protein n=1 Tax=Ideonella sp. A 288 TaxID=1962181 RepID=UPI000B4ADCCC|nr:spermidine synthase [Ideonella sp. A 288]